MSDEIKPSENVRACVCVCVSVCPACFQIFLELSAHSLWPSASSLLTAQWSWLPDSRGASWHLHILRAALWGGLPCKSPLLGSWVLLRETRGDPARLAQPPQEPAPGTQVWGPTCKPFPVAISGQDSGHQANYTPRGSCKEKDTISILPMT